MVPLAFLESEMIRKGKKPVDVAEIYGARCVYLLKAKNYILTNGNLALGDGGETHDIMNMLSQYGAMPQSAYIFENYGNGTVIPSEFQAGLKTILDNYIKNPDATKGASWKNEVATYLDEKLGKLPETFTYEGKNYTPRTFADQVIGINPNDYIEFSSFNDSPYYKKMVLPFQ